MTKPFLIAEAAINHNGDLERAMRMVEVAAEAGCDACKFQTYRTDDFCSPSDPMYQTFKRCEFANPSAWRLLKERCDECGIEFMSTPQNPSDLPVLLDAGIKRIKVGSDQMCNLQNLREYAKAGLPLILSCGMSSFNDINLALNATASAQKITLMVCTSQYPAPIDELNLRRITTLRGRYPFVEIGFSDHTLGWAACLAAISLGATVFEKHFTLDGDCPEGAFASRPALLRAWVDSIRDAHAMLGTGSMDLTPREAEAKRKFQITGGQLRGAA